MRDAIKEAKKRGRLGPLNYNVAALGKKCSEESGSPAERIFAQECRWMDELERKRVLNDIENATKKRRRPRVSKKKISTYEELGIDPHKTTVKAIFKKIICNDFPGAFCNIVSDPANNDYAITKHPDGSGSKSVQRCLHYLEAVDPTIFQNDADDALSMNTGDIAASGFVDRYFLTDIIAINAGNINKDVVLGGIALGIARNIALYRKYGIEIIFLGGETADLPDQTNSYILDMDVFARTDVRNVIRGNVRPGDKIFGFSSGGRAVWEPFKNSGQMSNGLTMARIKLMHSEYAGRYPFLSRTDKPYRGRHRVNDPAVRKIGMRVTDAILSPTRQWAIVIKLLMEELKKRNLFHLLHGISMNTGGGATKIKNIGEGITYRKYMPEPLPYFKFIQKETGEHWENMYTTFNMGVGLDIVGSDERGVLSKAIRAVSRMTGVKSFSFGDCHKSSRGNKVILETAYGKFPY